MVRVWLRGLRIQGQVGLAEETGDEVGSVLDAFEQGLDRDGELVDGDAGVVAQVAFDMRPDPFSRFAAVQVELDRAALTRRLSVGRGCCGWSSWLISYGPVSGVKAVRCGRHRNRRSPRIPAGMPWALLPEPNRREAVAVLIVLVERLAGRAVGSGGRDGGDVDAAV
ncbi:hypothetical protein FF36_06197 [Frankia torreyi]|uniref:Uncharacterized protein n=1 Tax=Frankia torreyi TaxID=1856 RepID=A0A0D8B6H7_9ACTN|nr:MULTISPECIES: hypothetical protein [Frankia]KJE19539.1 hypothetical protein FF36_06197 [Frankia torreyi]